MTAKLLPFPLARRADFVRRHAQHVATLRPTQGSKYLERQLEIQAGTLARRGFSEGVIGRELAALKGAISAEAWRFVMFGQSGDVA